TLREGRVCRWLRHRARDVPGGRAAVLAEGQRHSGKGEHGRLGRNWSRQSAKNDYRIRLASRTTRASTSARPPKLCAGMPAAHFKTLLATPETNKPDESGPRIR